MSLNASSSFFFFFNDTATTEIYTLSLHDALPIFDEGAGLQLVTVADGGGHLAREDHGTVAQVFLAPRARQVELHGRERERDDDQDQQAQQDQLLAHAQAHAPSCITAGRPREVRRNATPRSIPPHVTRR